VRGCKSNAGHAEAGIDRRWIVERRGSAASNALARANYGI